ncbi:GumC family protein [Armatimonas rosea]|uniref:Capsular polysaccharide biosynthesis protein n=1 Tax=Armatimonas rosea TaxID=685828 RepID=A0A7W9SVX1_ARMRO|nr:polysaccharide biosynthesis tyrosine autokinase [Armatimonas rosea]MBB6053169.1 capsular polysaccharide biosynthesis protein [Armatimonas rosea]
MDIWRAVAILNRRKWLILFSVVITTALTFGATRLVGSKWEATVKLLAPQTASRANGTEQGHDGYDVNPTNSKAITSMYNSILLSREVVEPAFKKIQENLPTGGELPKQVEFVVVGPRLFEIQVTTNQAEKAELLANALAESFVEYNHVLNTKDTYSVVKILQEQLRKADAELAKARTKYSNYSQEHKVIGTSDDETRSARTQIDTYRAEINGVQQELAVCQTRLSNNQRRLAEIESLLRSPRPAVTGANSKAISAEIDRITGTLASLQARYGAEYPEVKRSLITRDDLIKRLKTAQDLERTILTYDEKVSQQADIQKNNKDTQARILELQARQETLSKAITNEESRAMESKNLSDPVNSLANEVNSKSESRAAILARLNAALMAHDVAQRENPLVILERVNSLNPPVNISSGRTFKLIGLSAICALLGSCALIIALDSVDKRIKSVSEAERSYPVRILATIPQPEGTMSYADLARIAELKPRALATEAYRFLGLHMLNDVTPNMRSIMVISAKAEQGSTTTITNLAITLAQAGKKVVLVDANTRTAELHQVFKTPNDFGFTDLLMNPTISSFEKALMQTTVENLQIITSGTSPENPWETYRSSNLRMVSKQLRDIADYVLDVILIHQGSPGIGTFCQG